MWICPLEGEQLVNTTLAELGSQMVDQGMLSASQLRQTQETATKSERKHQRLRTVLSDMLANQKRLTHYQQATLEQGRGYLLGVGPYVVFEALGNGAMSCVYRARHRATGEMVALKLVPKRLTRNARVVQLWRREVEAALTVDHPNLVGARHAQIRRPPFYLAMDLVEGPTLKYLLAHRGAFDVPTALALVEQAAHGLDALDRHGFVHRDVKPGNVMATWQGHVKLIDFGFSHDPGRPDAITRDGLVMGTANYMAPEAVRSGHQRDIRADLYSLGVTFYELLTGALPFPSGSRSETLRARRRGQPRDPRHYVPHLPDEVVSVLLHVLRREPQRRYQSPQELLSALRPLREFWCLPSESSLAGAIAMEPSTTVEPLEDTGQADDEPSSVTWLERLVHAARSTLSIH